MAAQVSAEEKHLLEAIQRMGIQPTADTTEDLEEWMLSYLQSAGKLPAKTEDESVSTDTGEAQDTGKMSDAKPTSSQPKTTFTQALRITTFSGDPESKDATFDLWSYEVRCLIKDGVHSKEIIRQAVWKSLKGEAARAVMRLGPNTTTEQMLDKLDGVFGVVDAGETLLSEFYAAKQGKSESVAAWGCRLEDLLDRARRQGFVSRGDTDEMLRNRFWVGLIPQLKQSSRHKYDAVKTFDKLRVEMRVIERELAVDEDTSAVEPGKKEVGATAKMAMAQTEVSELKGILHKLTNNFQDMQTEIKQLKQTGVESQVGVGHVQQQQQQQQQQRFGQGSNSRPTGQVTGSKQQGQYIPQQQGSQQQGFGTGSQQIQQPPQQQYQDNAQGQQQPFQTQGCWRCGNPGHRKIDCPEGPQCYQCNRRGHIQRYCPYNPLNYQRPL